MGPVHAEIKLRNPKSSHEINVTAMADSGSLLMCIPKHVAIQLQLDELEKREVTLADGSSQVVPYVGPLEIHFLNRHCYTGALVLGDEPLLGAGVMKIRNNIVIFYPQNST